MTAFFSDLFYLFNLQRCCDERWLSRDDMMNMMNATRRTLGWCIDDVLSLIVIHMNLHVFIYYNIK